MASTSRLVGRRSTICSMSGVSQAKYLPLRDSVGARTCDVEVQDLVLLYHIVQEFLGFGIDDEDFPLWAALVGAWQEGGQAHVVAGNVSEGREDDWNISAASLQACAHQHRTLSLRIYDRHHGRGVSTWEGRLASRQGAGQLKQLRTKRRSASVCGKTVLSFPHDFGRLWWYCHREVQRCSSLEGGLGPRLAERMPGAGRADWNGASPIFPLWVSAEQSRILSRSQKVSWTVIESVVRSPLFIASTQGRVIVMLPLHRPASRCIYCAFRTHQSALRAQRLRSASSIAEAVREANHGSNNKGFRRIEIGERRRQDRRSGPVKDKPLIRKGAHDSPFGGPPHGKFQRFRPSAETFKEALEKRVAALKNELREAPMLQSLEGEAGNDDGKRDAKFDKLWRGFIRSILVDEEVELPWVATSKQGQERRKTRQDLVDAFARTGNRGLDDRIKYAFYGHVTGERFTESDIRNQKALADLRYPAEWFPPTRTMQRTVHVHVGPTNSGKTYQALKRLEQAHRGVYAGPLRLLAHEVYSRMNAKGRPCSLITGEERRHPPDFKSTPDGPLLTACTVEMVPINMTMDVCVIDEIQMIGSPERGWAWTQALMGVKAKEIHLCGEERTVPLIKELCASVGDKVEIHAYERLSPLKMADESLNGDLRKLRKGDCIVSFSVIGIHALRKQIEQRTGRKVATVYGSLPPETRAQQAKLFNDPDNDYDFLVASDAVGMGLNLAIKRIIFEASSKFDGIQRRTLSVADIKQIAGRAGRYRTATFNAATPEKDQDLAAAKGDSPLEVLPSPTATTDQAADGDEEENVGLVTTLEPFDYPLVSAAMSSQPEPIRTAGLFPPSNILERFSSYFPPNTPFSYILIRLHELSQMHSRFHLCGLREQIWIADLIEGVKGLTVTDRNAICSAPASRGEEMWKTLMPAYARCIAEQRGGHLADIDELPLEILEAEASASREYLHQLERLHKGIVTYLWLSYRFAGVFGTRGLAFHVKQMVEEKIEEVLGKFSFTEVQRRKIAAKRERDVLAAMEAVASRGGRDEDVIAAATAEGEDEAALEDERSEDGFGLDGELDAEAPGSERFSSESDFPVEDPDTAAMVQEGKAAVSSFAEWRTQQRKGESQASAEEDEGEVNQARSANAPDISDAEVSAIAAEQAVEARAPAVVATSPRGLEEGSTRTQRGERPPPSESRSEAPRPRPRTSEQAMRHRFVALEPEGSPGGEERAEGRA